MLGRSSELLVLSFCVAAASPRCGKPKRWGTQGTCCAHTCFRSAAIWQRGLGLRADQGNPKPKNQKTRKPHLLPGSDCGDRPVRSLSAYWFSGFLVFWFSGLFAGQELRNAGPGVLSGRCVSTLWQTQALGHTGHWLCTHMLPLGCHLAKGAWALSRPRESQTRKPKNQKTRKPCCFQEATAVTDQYGVSQHAGFPVFWSFGFQGCLLGRSSETLVRGF